MVEISLNLIFTFYYFDEKKMKTPLKMFSHCKLSEHFHLFSSMVQTMKHLENKFNT